MNLLVTCLLAEAKEAALEVIGARDDDVAVDDEHFTATVQDDKLIVVTASVSAPYRSFREAANLQINHRPPALGLGSCVGERGHVDRVRSEVPNVAHVSW